MLNHSESNYRDNLSSRGRQPVRKAIVSVLPISMVIGATLAGFIFLGQALAQGAQPSTSADSGKYPYTYHNSFKKGVGDFVATDEVGGDVFAPSIKPGDSFPVDVTIYDEKNQPHKIREFLQKDRSLILVLAFISAPRVMDQIIQFQKAEQASGTESSVVVVNVSQFGSSLQPNTPMADTGRTIDITAKEYGLTLPFYWVHNDIYSADGFTNKLRVRDLPTYIVINGNGKVAKVFGSDHTQWSAGDFSTGS